MMHMTFYWSKEVTLLVDTWRTGSWPAYSLTLLACFLASALYQFLEHSRIRLKLLNNNSSNHPPPMPRPGHDVETPLLKINPLTKPRCPRGAAAAEGILFGVNSAVGYLLMLAVMSFNGGVFLSIVFGLTLGYLAFRSGGGGEFASVAVDNPCACA